MATTFKIYNGDVIVKSITGRPDLIGNPIGENDLGQSKLKTGQDLKRSLSISRIRDGSGAGISELVGNIDGAGVNSIAIMVKARIMGMFASILRLQKRRTTVRPNTERFAAINSMQVVPQVSDKTTYKFRLDARTVAGRTIVQSGTIVP